jgi:hypothetical protein
MLQEMEQQLANVKKSTDERIMQEEQHIQETQEAWQEAIIRASEAEKRTRVLEKTVSSLQEQLHVDQIHRQLWAPDRSEAPAATVVNDTLTEEPAMQVVGNSSHDTPMEGPASDESNNDRRSNDDDTEMSEVNRMFDCYVYTSSSILGIV